MLALKKAWPGDQMSDRIRYTYELGAFTVPFSPRLSDLLDTAWAMSPMTSVNSKTDFDLAWISCFWSRVLKSKTVLVALMNKIFSSVNSV